ncbi:MAG: hypothetical protein Athens101428_333 [Candidatus Berkelbacteria bacterium Athens1014_28]|uniref:Type II toxin-antitoxin system RelE/ParE family toxin n=1 Tax=Candidatus Berkelbacteria bacterium Athens1014_28 TaxID=2017145 RepID=A0A554LN28_9BACT|nr:MAG: hypothetical protein Athens101428_333 [Candidatus Berkelbacteria bacterium Athens1014_28]
MPEIFEVETPKSILKSLKKIPLPWRERILDAMSILARNPFLGEKMSGELQDKRKIRVWPYRIIYKINIKRKHIIITDVGHRGNIGYK